MRFQARKMIKPDIASFDLAVPRKRSRISKEAANEAAEFQPRQTSGGMF